MATKSIYKDVNIRDSSLARKFVHALENAQNKHSKEVVLSKKYSTIDKSKIKDIFGEKPID